MGLRINGYLFIFPKAFMQGHNFVSLRGCNVKYLLLVVQATKYLNSPFHVKIYPHFSHHS